MDTVEGLFDVSDEHKRDLLEALQVLSALQGDSPSLDELLVAARINCISKIEVYFLQDPSQLRQPLNLRNEAAAVSLLLGHYGSRRSRSSGDPAQAALLAALAEYSRKLWPELASGDVAVSSGSGSGSGSGLDGSSSSGQPEQQAAQLPRGQAAPPGSPGADFEAWAREQGVAAAISLASFGSLRGCAASRDVAPGEPLLSIPADVLIYEDSVKGTDLGRMLHAIPDLTIDNLLVLFTMIDRHDEDSRWARYWHSLPDKYYTGISFPQPLVDSLAGTAAHLELARAQQHLQDQYAATRPLFDMLLTAYPQFLKPEWFDYDCYLWAAELWYSYAFEVEFPAETPKGAAAAAAGPKSGASAASRGKGTKGKGSGSKAKRSGSKASSLAAGTAVAGVSGSSSSGGGSSSSKPVMVPFACHINHSPWPHCVRYGRLNPKTRTLDYPAFRPCQAGQQVFISYGPVPNLKLLCYYGFVVPHNPHDLVPLQLEPPEGPLKQQQLAAMEALGLGLEHSLQDGPLSKQLLACLRLIVATSAELQLVVKHKVDPLAGAIAPENEDQALRTLEAALVELLAPLELLPLLLEEDLPAEAGAVEGAEARQADVSAAGGSSGGGNDGETAPAQEQAEGALEQLHLQGAAAAASGSMSQEAAAGQHQEGGSMEAKPQQQQQQQQQDQCNENGFDADWHMSRRFCKIYLQGQHHILQRSLQECRRLLRP